MAEPTFGHERFEVYRLSIAYVAFNSVSSGQPWGYGARAAWVADNDRDCALATATRQLQLGHNRHLASFAQDIVNVGGIEGCQADATCIA